MVNTELAKAVRAGLDLPSPDLSTLASYFRTRFMNEQRHIDDLEWVPISFISQYTRKAIEERGLPKVPRMPKRERELIGVREVDDDFGLDAGPVDGLTDDFLGNVARAYVAAVARGERPNVAISEQTGYPLKSVQRWVYTARQRGIMPRGSKGRPG